MTAKTITKKQTRPLTPESLRELLWETANGVKNRELTPNRATAVAFNAREILNLCKYQLAVARFVGEKSPTPSFALLEADTVTKQV